MSLIHNLVNPEYQHVVDYITGPGYIEKWVCKDKIIYLFGEVEHSNSSGYLKYGNSMLIERYLMNLVKNSPVFIDFFIEFPVFIDGISLYNRDSIETLWDILDVTKGCFGPLEKRKCPYNVRMHSVDARSVLSTKHTESMMVNMHKELMHITISKNPISVKLFIDRYLPEINNLIDVRTNEDLIQKVLFDIKNNTLVMKELKRSLYPDRILDFFVNIILRNRLNDMTLVSYKISNWFKTLLEKDRVIFPDNIKYISNVLTILTAPTMDVYTCSRMFKVFNVKHLKQPIEPQNIIYYAGNGHTMPMGTFLKDLKFKRVEKTTYNLPSYVCMKGIKQPLFSV